MDARQQSVLVKNETTYGTDPTPVNTDGLVLWDFAADVENQPGYSRAVQGAYNGRQRVNYLGGRHMSWSARQELRGKSQNLTAAIKPPWHDLLIAAGWVATWNGGTSAWDYVPAGIGVDGSEAGRVNDKGSNTIKWARGGLQHVLVGARSGWRIEIEARKPPMIYWVGGLARYTVPAAAAYVAATPADEQAPVTSGATAFTPWGYTPGVEYGHIRKVVIDGRCQTEITDSLSLGTEGVGVVRNVGRGTVDDPGIAVQIELEQPNSVHPNDSDLWISKYATQAVDSLRTITLGSAAGNTITISIAQMQVIEVHPIMLGRRFGQRIEARAMLSAAALSEDDVLITAT